MFYTVKGKCIVCKTTHIIEKDVESTTYRHRKISEVKCPACGKTSMHKIYVKTRNTAKVAAKCKLCDWTGFKSVTGQVRFVPITSFACPDCGSHRLARIK